MLYDLGVWAVGLFLSSPVAVLGVAWARSRQFYDSRLVERPQKVLYCVALATASLSVLPYLGYWAVRVCLLYQIKVPFSTLLAVARSVYAGRLLSAMAIVCLLIGRGPYRILVALAVLWVMLQLWIHGDLIHWA
jgi:hypothetical protein